MEFDNSYLPAPIDVPLNVRKIMTGNELPEGKSYEFTFTIANVSAFRLNGITEITPAPMPQTDGVETTSVTITVNSESEADALTKAFGLIHFAEVGIFTYTVTETMKDNYTGMTCEEPEKTVVIKIKDIGGELAIDEITGVKENGSVYEVEVTNNYTPTPVDLPLSAKKIMKGSELPKGVDYSFFFRITAVTENAPLPQQSGADHTMVTFKVNSTTDPASMVEIFGDIHFTAAGTYTYTVKETMAGTYPGMTPLEGSKTVTVKVKDNDGVLEIEEVTGATKTGTAYIVSLTNLYSEVPKTGDDSSIVPYSIAMCGSGLLLMMLWLDSKKRRAKKDEDEEAA